MKTLYEINWHYTDKEQTKFSHCTVTHIEVLREGILPGCSGVSITAKGGDGRVFQGTPRDYFDSEAAAWDNVKSGLTTMADDNDTYIEFLKEEARAMRAFLAALPDQKD